MPAPVQPRTAPDATPARPRGFGALSSRPFFATLVLGFVLGIGALFAWRRNQPAEAADATATIAVLPFENLGDSADAYFADGVTDAVRGNLTAISGLRVIARGSSEPYRGTDQKPKAIAQELGVRYLLTGTVRWVKQPDGSSRVQVRPELVEIAEDGAPRSRWQQPFDAPLTDVFKVQGEIASEVAQAL
jgi:TolB-like protein